MFKVYMIKYFINSFFTLKYESLKKSKILSMKGVFHPYFARTSWAYHIIKYYTRNILHIDIYTMIVLHYNYNISLY